MGPPKVAPGSASAQALDDAASNQGVNHPKKPVPSSSLPPEGPTPNTSVDPADCKELRLALVLSGGVSLAIYMHGTTLELHKLARASAALEAQLNLGGPPIRSWKEVNHHAYPGSWDTENVYIDALLLLSSRERHRLKVIIDIIGGTSAGGINGVVLAQALAINGSQDGIKKLWIQEGGVEQLVREPGSKPGFGSKAISRVDDMLARFSNHFSPGLFRNTSAIAGSAIKILGDSKEALFSGANYGIKLHDAFRTVAASALPSAVVNIDSTEFNNSPLVPNKLELLATCTNVRGVRGPVMAGSNADGRVTNVSYRQVMKFVHEGQGKSSFGGKFISALAFAARATSSFPGAFPPVSVDSFAEILKTPVNFDTPDPLPPSFQYATRSADTPPSDRRTPIQIANAAAYCDGGVTDNFPFQLVIDAIRDQQATLQTTRELIYLEPDPKTHVEPHATGELPTVLETLRAAASTIPSALDLADALDEMAKINSTITRTGAVVQQIMNGLMPAQAIAGAIALPIPAPAFPAALLPMHASLSLIAEGERFGLMLTQKLSLPPKSTTARAVIDIFCEEVRLSPGPRLAYESRRCAFALEGVDDALRRTRRVNESIDDYRAERQYLINLKASLWEWKIDLGAAGLAAVEAALEALPATFNLADPLASLNGSMLDHSAAELWTAYAAALQLPALQRAVPQAPAQPVFALHAMLRARLDNFAAWDQILFTLHSLARIPSLKPIHVRRFSPLDATQLFKPVNRAITEQRSGVQFPAPPPPDPADPDKVKGRSLFHFGAFFSKEARQQDYLTGRLDGVELILKMLREKAGTGSTMTEEEEREEGRAIKVLACDAYKAVVAAERMGAEPLSGDLLDFVGQNIEQAWAKI